MTKRQMYLLDDVRCLLRDTADALWNSQDRINDESVNHVPIRDDEKQALEPLFNEGYEIVGHGISRIVLRMPDQLNEFVVKIGRYGDELSSIGMNQNRNEILLSELSFDETPLLPVLDWQHTNPRWIVMPHGEQLDSIEEEEKQESVEYIKYSISHLDYIREEEIHSGNIVKWNGRVWLSDYGSQTPKWV